MDEICPIFTPTDHGSKPWEKLWQAAGERWRSVTADAQRFEGQLMSQLVVGFGGKGVLDFGLTLDHVTGLPIIPGSALKGVCRAYGLLIIAADNNIPLLTSEEVLARAQANNREGTKKKSLVEWLDTYLTTSENSDSDKNTHNDALQALTSRGFMLEGLKSEAAINYKQIFGNTESAGQCIFYDAVVSRLPSNKSLFQLDIMTPHYAPYYQDDKRETPPHDALAPLPITFLTVRESTHFNFAVGLREPSTVAIAAQTEAVAWLQSALETLGVGSKTAAGYGAFQII